MSDREQAISLLENVPDDKMGYVVAVQRPPNGEDIKRLKGRPDLLRLRVGNYRIIDSVGKGEWIVYVMDAGNRGEVYNRYEMKKPLFWMGFYPLPARR